MTGAELKAWRRRVDLRQDQAAALLPVSLGTWRGWEQGRFKMPEYLARALRDVERELKAEAKCQ